MLSGVWQRLRFIRVAQPLRHVHRIPPGNGSPLLHLAWMRICRIPVKKCIGTLHDEQVDSLRNDMRAWAANQELRAVHSGFDSDAAHGIRRQLQA